MRDQSRIISTLIMVLTIAVSGVGLAQVRAMAPAVGEAVLCVANGPVTIYIDASGQPTSPPAHCVECALALTAVLPQVTAQLHHHYHGYRAFRTDSGQPHSARDVMVPPARGPPVA